MLQLLPSVVEVVLPEAVDVHLLILRPFGLMVGAEALPVVMVALGTLAVP